MKGGRISYSPEELRFVQARCALPRREIHAEFVARFGRTDVGVDNIKQLCTREGWLTGRRRWTTREYALLRRLYPDTATAEIAKRLGRSLTTVYQRAIAIGLRKSEAYLTSPAACRLRRGDKVGAATRFQRGHAPANKGLRRPGWYRGRMRDTQFKKGQRGSKWKPVGSERVVEGYLYTKVSDIPNVPWTKNWKPTHWLRWTEKNGPLPKGSVLKSLDGNPRNTDPDNWIAIDRGLLPRLNGIYGRDYDRAPAEIKPAIMAISKLEHAARRTRKTPAGERVA